jgi:hypothetical protein
VSDFSSIESGHPWETTTPSISREQESSYQAHAAKIDEEALEMRPRPPPDGCLGGKKPRSNAPGLLSADAGAG